MSNEHDRARQLSFPEDSVLLQGEKFTSTEATEVFFSVTKLFQSKETMLRRMVYLVIKALTECAHETSNRSFKMLGCNSAFKHLQRVMHCSPRISRVLMISVSVSDAIGNV